MDPSFGPAVSPSKRILKRVVTRELAVEDSSQLGRATPPPSQRPRSVSELNRRDLTCIVMLRRVPVDERDERARPIPCAPRASPGTRAPPQYRQSRPAGAIRFESYMSARAVNRDPRMCWTVSAGNGNRPPSV